MTTLPRLKRQIWHPFSSLLLVVACCLTLQNATAAEPQKPIIVSTYTAAITEHNSFLKNRNAYQVDDYEMNEDVTPRVILEMVLLQQALRRGGLERPIRFNPGTDDYRNTLDLVEAGKLLMHSDSYWLQDLSARKDQLYISAATIEKSQYVVGLYTSPENQRALDSANNIRQLSAVSNRAWSADWQALESLQLESLKHVRHWRFMANMVQHSDTDFLLAPFQGTGDLAMGRGKFKLIPIPGVKVALHDSRHFAISKQHPDGQQLAEALDRGIKQMKASGRWLHAYRQAGVINPLVDEWVLLNPR